MKICYIEKIFRTDKLELILLVNRVVDEYNAQGYSLTLRQVYYQLVARDVIPNNMRSYKNLGSLINDARLAGLIDWDAIEDRTRNLQSRAHWESPEEIIYAVAHQYHRDYWEGQENHVEVWVEKDALIGVVGKICDRLDINYFSCRGYTSQSELWRAAMRLREAEGAGLRAVLLHLGDHDPSGIDMSRDIQDRLRMFGVEYLEFDRLALNYDQVERYNPPPNPAKMTDSRFNGYVESHGADCWELDALEPSVISDLIETSVLNYLDPAVLSKVKGREEAEREQLASVANDWDNVVGFINLSTGSGA